MLFLCDCCWVSASALHAARLHQRGSSSQYMALLYVCDACSHLPQIQIRVGSCQCKKIPKVSCCFYATVSGSALQSDMLLDCMRLARQDNLSVSFLLLTLVITSQSYK